MFQQVLPFEDAFAWKALMRSLRQLNIGQRFVFYGVGKKIEFLRIDGARVRISTSGLSAHFPTPTFEETFMAAVLRDTHKHLHIYEKSATRNPDWRKQIYRCIDPDCHSFDRAERIIGKRARCHECKSEIIIDKGQIKNAIIVGLCCSKSHKAIVYRAAKSKVGTLLMQAEAEAEAETSITLDTLPELPDEIGFDDISSLFGVGLDLPSTDEKR